MVRVKASLKSNRAEFTRKLDSAVASAMDAVGAAAVDHTVNQMNTGYPKRPYQTGKLIGTMGHRLEYTDTVVIGSPQPYAIYVHDGTRKMAKRPFLRDTLYDERVSRDLEEVATDTLKEELHGMGII